MPFENAEGSMSKLKASEVAVRACEQAVQTLGGWGYIKDFPVEKWYRDAKLYTIFEGTSEIQRLVIGRALRAKANTEPLDQPHGGAAVMLCAQPRKPGAGRIVRRHPAITVGRPAVPVSGDHGGRWGGTPPMDVYAAEPSILSHGPELDPARSAP